MKFCQKFPIRSILWRLTGSSPSSTSSSVQYHNRPIAQNAAIVQNLCSNWRLLAVYATAGGLLPLGQLVAEFVANRNSSESRVGYDLAGRLNRLVLSQVAQTQPCVRDSSRSVRPKSSASCSSASASKASSSSAAEGEDIEATAQSLSDRALGKLCSDCTSRGVAEAKAGRVQKAQSLWEAAAKFAYPPALFNLGQLANRLGQLPRAREYFLAAAELGHAAAAYNLSLLLQPAEAQQARHWLQAAARAGLGSAQLLEATHCLNEGRVFVAEQLICDYLQCSYSYEAELLLCRCLLRSGRTAEAEQRLLALSLDYADAALLLARIRQCGLYGLAIDSAAADALHQLALANGKQPPAAGSGDAGQTAGLLRNSCSLPDFSAAYRCSSAAGSDGRHCYYPSFYRNCSKQLHKY